MLRLKSILILIVIIGVFSQAANVTTIPTIDAFDQFQIYITSFGKKFTTISDLTSKFITFQKNLDTITSLNLVNNYENDAFGHTLFSDMDPLTFKKQYLTLNVDSASLNKSKIGGYYISTNSTTPSPLNVTDPTTGHRFLASKENLRNLQTAPVSLDWRTKGAVQVIKNQGACGDCWAFATAGNMESQFFIKYGVLHNFSEQQLLDCAIYNSACNGGNMATAMQYIMNSYGLETTYNYGSYLAKQKSCSAVSYLGLGLVTGWYFPGTDETMLKNWLYTHGPVAVAINASPLQYYTSGIINLNAQYCDPKLLDHAVQIVGYGTSNGLDYWIVKNSWGPYWGEAGYFRILRGYSVCGINQYVISAVLG